MIKTKLGPESVAGHRDEASLGFVTAPLKSRAVDLGTEPDSKLPKASENLYRVSQGKR
jgi:hypothetical protein